MSIEWWEYLAVLAGLLAVSWLLDRLVRSVAPEGSLGKSYGAATMFIGEDGRTSTSKLQATLWTYAVLWALISVLVWLGADTFSDALSGTFGSSEATDKLREEYLLLLGGPYAVAIAAKRITAAKKEKDPEVKQPKQPRPRTGTWWSRLKERLVEVVSNDAGDVDLGDFQYFAFTLLSLAFFVCAFVADPADGLPPVPATLLVLMGLSQATYVGKKGLLPDAAPPDPEAAGGAGSAATSPGASPPDGPAAPPPAPDSPPATPVAAADPMAEVAGSGDPPPVEKDSETK